MKKALLFSFLFITFSCLLAQNTGTIKIAKPILKDTVVKKIKDARLYVSLGANYTFLKNNKIGYEFGVGYRITPHHLNGYDLSIIYSKEFRYFNKFNSDNNSFFIEKSQTTLEYIKIPLRMSHSISLGQSSNFRLAFGVGGKYLFQVKNENNYFSLTKYNRYNGFFFFDIKIPIIRNIYNISISYSRDFFENLKDVSLYDNNNNVIGKQKTKTNLLSIAIVYKIKSIKN